MLVYEHTRGFPDNERFGLTAQMRRGVVSIASNIVEGCARNSKADYVRFLDMAYGATRELEYQISLAARLGFLTPESSALVRPVCEETAKVLNGLIRALRKS